MFLLLSGFWGASYLFIKVALDDGVAPWAIVSARTALAALVLVPLAAFTGVLGSLRGRFVPIVVLGLVQAAAPLTLIAVGEERISSSLTGILVSTAPIFTFLLAFALTGAERASRASLAGVAIGIVGVGMLLGVDAGGGSEALVGGLFVILAAFGYAVGAWYLKRNLTGVEPVATVAGTQVVAALATLPLGLLHIPESIPSGEAIASIATLGIFCTGIAFVFFHSLVATEGPATASLVGYVAPGFSVFYGVVLLDESFTAVTAAGLVLILGGSWQRRAASCPHAAAMSRPRVSRTVARTPRSSRAALKAAIASRPEPR
jgi:drug/metabolite transporter (DMT)-like permease